MIFDDDLQFIILQICSENADDNMSGYSSASVHGVTVDNRIMDPTTMRTVCTHYPDSFLLHWTLCRVKYHFVGRLCRRCAYCLVRSYNS